MGGDRAVRILGWAAGLLLFVGLLVIGFLPVPVVVLSIPFLVIAARKPVLRRLAVRNASRRPRETALILLGALLGTAIITGSATVGDTLGNSIRQGASTKLGPVDEIVRGTDAAQQQAILTTLEAAPSPDIDGILPIVTVNASVATAGSPSERKAEPRAALVEIDFADARAFGSDPGITGISGATPAAGRAVIGADLAKVLDAGPGDSVQAFVYGATATFTVDRVLPRKGIAGFSLGFGGESPNLFVTPGTISTLAAGRPGAGSPPASLVAISNRGGVFDAADLSDSVSDGVLQPALDAAGINATVDKAKSGLLDAAERQGSSFTQLFTALGTFSALAGILLLISIFIMLAEERKTELGMLRAVGLKRAGLIGTFSLEGWMYSLGSSALGTIAGIGVGRAIVLVTSGIFAAGGGPGGGGERGGLQLQFTATQASIQRGFLVGFIFSLLTVLATSVWVSRLNVIRAIRDLPDPTVAHRRLGALFGGVFLALAGLAMTRRGFAASAPAPLLAGPAVAALGLAMVLRRWVNTRVIDTVAALAGLFWATFCFDIAKDVFNGPDISLFVLDGVILSVAGVMLVSRHQRIIGGVVRRAGGGNKNMSLRLGLAYPLAKAFRTSLILSTFTLVMFTLISITLFSGVFGQQIDTFTSDISGGFDGQVSSNGSNPVSVDAVRNVDGVALVAPLATVGTQFDVAALRDEPATPKFEFWPLGGYDGSFVEGGPPSLQKFLPKFGSEAGAWRALLTDPSLIIVDEFFLQRGGGPPSSVIKVGDPVTVRDPVSGTTRQLTVAALANSGFGQAPAYQGVDAVRSLVGDRAVTNLLRYRAAPGADPQVVAERINGQFVENGVSATSFRKMVGTGLATQQQFFRLMQGYLSLGLVVSVAGIGVVMVRAVRERRREVGVLRSLGFETKQVRRAFLAESTFVALEGIFLGTGLALISTWRLLTSGAFGDGLTFSVPIGQLAVIIGLAFVATLAATASPAQQASKIRPAVALRIAD